MDTGGRKLAESIAWTQETTALRGQQRQPREGPVPEPPQTAGVLPRDPSRSLHIDAREGPGTGRWGTEGGPDSLSPNSLSQPQEHSRPPAAQTPLLCLGHGTPRNRRVRWPAPPLREAEDAQQAARRPEHSKPDVTA